MFLTWERNPRFQSSLMTEKPTMNSTYKRRDEEDDIDDDEKPVADKSESKTKLPKLVVDPKVQKGGEIKPEPHHLEYIKRLEEEDSRPDQLALFQNIKKKASDRCCMCDACKKRRLWLAMRVVAGEDEAASKHRALLDEFVIKAFQGDTKFVEKVFHEVGDASLHYMGGPVAISNCEVCQAKPNIEKCYHCGKDTWMRCRADLRTARKDLTAIPRYLVMTALHAACLGGQVQMVQQLIKYGSDLQVVDEAGCTPLHWITCNGHKPRPFQSKMLTIWEILSKFDVDVTQLDSSGKAAIELTVPPNPPFKAMRVQILKGRKQALNEQLIEYCQDGNSDMVFRLLRAGADLGSGDWLNDTPLHASITFGHHDLAFAILKAAEEENRSFSILTAKSVDGMTAYDAAIKWGFPAVAKRLKALENAARVREMTEQIIRGGVWEVPRDLKGTLLGKQLENELKQRSKAAKAARLTVVAQKKEAIRQNRLQEENRKRAEKEAAEEKKRQEKEAALQKQAKEQEKMLRKGLAAAMDAATGRIAKPEGAKSKICTIC